jgi:tetratricopeptide (TPR) repeat protein
MSGSKRLLLLIGIAIGIFVVGMGGLAALVAVLYYEKIDVLNNPLLTSLTQATTLATQAAQGEMLTDHGDYKTENNWIASKTAREIAGMAWMVVHPDRPVPKFKVKATVDTQKSLVHLELTGWSDEIVSADLKPSYAWDPKAYAEFAHQLLGDQKAVEPPADSSGLLTDLLTPTGEVLAKKDLEISQALSQNPASADLNDKAGLLLLTLALRENAGILSDTRVLACRACAHLAMAQALRDSESPLGTMAEATLLTLSGREVDALQKLAALDGHVSPAVPIWTQALTLLNKGDWRIASPDQNTPLLVKIIWAQVLSDNFDDTIAMTYLDRMGTLEDVPDWGRALITEGDEPDVDVGHRFCASTLGLEFKELKSILAAEGDALQNNVPLRDIFNHPVGPSVAVDASGKTTSQVIGTDLFKDIAERHIISAIWQMHFWLRNSWGVPDQDAKFIQEMTTLFRGTRREQYVALFLNASGSNDFPTTGSLRDDVADIPPCFSLHLTWPESDCTRLIPYFGWGIPFGAPFEMKQRWRVTLNALTSHHQRDPNAPTFKDLIPLAPDSYTLPSWNILTNQQLHIPNTEKDEKAALEQFFDYNTNSLGFFRRLSDNQSDFDEATKEEILRKQTVLDPDEFYTLGNYLIDHGKADEAADAFRKGAAQGADQVLFANSIRPLVEYDFNHGQLDEAMSMAKKAADVYSANGIQTYIWLLCKLDHYDQAEDWAGKLDERYGGQEKSYFYAAHADHFPDQFAAEVKKRFPDGMNSVSLASFTVPPTQGCTFSTSSPELQRAGLHAGDVAVALDSHPVVNMDTYYFARAMSDAPVMDLIVWQNGKYVEVKASPPSRRFGNKLADYNP